ncbi:MAG: T9SS type A sorting domain-containing protein [Bacteroidales bacterium]|nr:T9SS type A sorting domain-containing protein [Bacteroidales bacterium]
MIIRIKLFSSLLLSILFDKTINLCSKHIKLLGLAILFSVGFVPVIGQEGVTDLSGNYDIFWSTLGIGGVSNTVIADKGTYYISSSIGQSSVIGTFGKGGYYLRQGFQQPTISATVLRSPFENALSAKLYPNPFSRSISITFDEIIDEDIFVSIYNVSGGIVFSKKLPASQLIVLRTDDIFGGIYILRIKTGSKILRAQLIKLYQ